MGTRTRTKKERLEARVTAEQKALIEWAAALLGSSTTDFVVTTVQAAAEDAIRRHKVLILTARESEAFARAILDPPEPSDRLRALAREYREFVGE